MQQWAIAPPTVAAPAPASPLPTAAALRHGRRWLLAHASRSTRAAHAVESHPQPQPVGTWVLPKDMDIDLVVGLRLEQEQQQQQQFLQPPATPTVDDPSRGALHSTSLGRQLPADEAPLRLLRPKTTARVLGGNPALAWTGGYFGGRGASIDAGGAHASASTSGAGNGTGRLVGAGSSNGSSRALPPMQPPAVASSTAPFTANEATAQRGPRAQQGAAAPVQPPAARLADQGRGVRGRQADGTLQAPQTIGGSLASGLPVSAAETVDEAFSSAASAASSANAARDAGGAAAAPASTVHHDSGAPRSTRTRTVVATTFSAPQPGPLARDERPRAEPTPVPTRPLQPSPAPPPALSAAACSSAQEATFAAALSACRTVDDVARLVASYPHSAGQPQRQQQQPQQQHQQPQQQQQQQQQLRTVLGPSDGGAGSLHERREPGAAGSGAAGLSAEQAEAAVDRLASLHRQEGGGSGSRDLGLRLAELLVDRWQSMGGSGSDATRGSDSTSQPAEAAAPGTSSKPAVELLAERAALLLEQLASLGPDFYNRPLFDALLSVTEAHASLPTPHQQPPAGGPHGPAPGVHTLVRALRACAQAGHLLRRSAVARVATTLLHSLSHPPGLPPSLCVDALWAMGRYRVVLREQPGGAEVAAAAVAALEGAWTVQPRQPQRLRRGHGAASGEAPVAAQDVPGQGREKGLGLGQATSLATALADLELQPDPDWLDRWLVSLQPHLDPRTSAGAPHALLLSVSAFLSALSRLGYQPEQAWADATTACLIRLLGSAATTSTASTAPTAAVTSQEAAATVSPPTPAAETAESVVSALEGMATLNLAPAGVGLLCQKATTIIVQNGALLTGGCSLPSRLLAALARLLPSDEQPRWVRGNLPLLEQLLLAAAAHLRGASPPELVALVGACAALRFYPGNKFLRWHDGACAQLGKGFPDHLLYQMREAYISLGFKPERKLYLRMEAAKARVLRQRSMLRLKRRQGQGAVQKQGAAQRLRAKRSR